METARKIPPFRTLDALRGFAAAWVVMTHCCDRFLGTANMKYTSQPLYAFSIRGQLGVVFFFVISGYCITAAAYSALMSGKSIRRYAYERVRRIYPPYIAALILGVLAQLVIGFASARHWIAVHHFEPFSSSPRYWLANVLLLQSEFGTGFVNVVFWSLCYEVAFYAVIGAWLWIAQVTSKNRPGMEPRVRLFFLGIALTTYAALLSLVLFDYAPFPFDLWHQFALGGVLFFVIELKGYRWIALSMALLTLAFLIVRSGIDTDIGHPSSRVRSLTTLLFCFFLMFLRPLDERLTSSRWIHPLLWLGACSYSLYLIHPVVIPFVDILCRKAGLDGDRYWIAFWIQFAVALVAGRVFYHLVEKHFVSSRQKRRLVEEKAA